MVILSEEKSGAYERMRSELKKLGIYRLDGKSIVDVELLNYAHYIDQLNLYAESIFEESFIINLGSKNYVKYLKLYSLPEAMPLEQLKSTVLKRMAITNSDFTKAGILKCIEAGGFNATIAEGFETGTVKITINQDLGFYASKAEKENYIKQCLPCHVKPIFIWNS